MVEIKSGEIGVIWLQDLVLLTKKTSGQNRWLMLLTT